MPQATLKLTWLWTLLTLSLFLKLTETINLSLAFNGLTHSQITQSSFLYLQTHHHISPATDLWLQGGPTGNSKLTKSLLIRSLIDTDYRPNLWISGLFQRFYAGGIASSGLSVFTTLYHFTNVITPGVFWDYDGYAYRHTDGRGNDSLLATPTAYIAGELSTPLEGYNYDHPIHGIDIGPYHLGFRGTMDDWYAMFRGHNNPTHAVFPPSHVSAQLAYAALLRSPRSNRTWTDQWQDSLPLIESFVSSTNRSRHYWRAEIDGLPTGFDLLGFVLHMTQDLTMPHHTEGISSYCHPEIEAFVDELACASRPQPVSVSDYDSGRYSESVASCQSLYDPGWVESFLYKQRELQTERPIKVMTRLVDLAKLTARWRWRSGPSGQGIETVLPSGRIYRSATCDGFKNNQEIRYQLKVQYNLAVAATVLMFELAARDYEYNAQETLEFLGSEVPPLFYYWQRVTPGLIPKEFPINN